MPNTDNLNTPTRPIEDSPQEVIEDPFNELKEMLLLVSTLKSEAKTKVNIIFTNVLSIQTINLIGHTGNTPADNHVTCIFSVFTGALVQANMDIQCSRQDGVQ